VAESLGSEKFVYFSRELGKTHNVAELEELARDSGRADAGGAASETVVARLDPASRITEGHDARLWVDVRKLHVFDPATGRNLSLGTDGAPGAAAPAAAAGAGAAGAADGARTADRADQASAPADQGSTTADQAATTADQAATTADQASAPAGQESTTADQASTSADPGSTTADPASGTDSR
jgi:hypothetical protein